MTYGYDTAGRVASPKGVKNADGSVWENSGRAKLPTFHCEDTALQFSSLWRGVLSAQPAESSPYCYVGGNGCNQTDPTGAEVDTFCKWFLMLLAAAGSPGIEWMIAAIITAAAPVTIPAVVLGIVASMITFATYATIVDDLSTETCSR